MLMAGGEMCLLLTNRPPSFSDKMCQLRRRAALPRCLFGPPDPVETEKILREEMQRERDRFQRRWNIDLDKIEAAIEDLEKKNVREEPEDGEDTETDSRIPSVPAEVEDRLSSSLDKGDKTSRSDSYIPPTKKIGGCRKPCSKFQKRVRAAGSHKRQTCLTEFWRSRRTLAFVFGKTKARAVSLPSLTELLEPLESSTLD